MRSFYPRRLCLFVALSLADLLLTFQLVRGSDGEVREANPIAAAWLDAYGWAGLGAFKALMVLLVAGSCVFISRYRPRAGGGVLTYACLVTGAVVAYGLYGYYVLGFAGG